MYIQIFEARPDILSGDEHVFTKFRQVFIYPQLSAGNYLFTSLRLATCKTQCLNYFCDQGDSKNDCFFHMVLEKSSLWVKALPKHHFSNLNF